MNQAAHSDTNEIHVCAALVVSSYSLEASLFLRHSAASRSVETTSGEKPLKVSSSKGTHVTPDASARA